jgi:hypothetical protein
MSGKKPLNSAAIAAGVVCVILIVAIMALYFNENALLTNKDSEISSLKTQLANAGVAPNPSMINLKFK